MKCPNCADSVLATVLTTQGVEIDRCPACEGVWLERGEIFLFAAKAQSIAANLERARADRKPTDRLSPASGEPMDEITYPGGPHIDYCPRSGGLWLDAGELKALLGAEPGIRLNIDRKASLIPQAGARSEAPDVGGARRPASAMMALPNLLLRSTATLAGLYGLLGLVIIAAVEFAGVDLTWAVLGGLVAIILQFLIGPFMMDLSLRWLYKLQWLKPEELPEHLRAFVARVSDEQGIKHPRFAMIDDGAPQAFTYGHTPNNARIVLSRGIFELLSPEEAEAVVAHEIGHAVHWDMFLMTVAQLVPLIFYYVYRTLIRMRSRGGKDSSAGARIAIAVGAYILYIISEYVVLWFSRTREYHADRFAGSVTGNPSLIASALVKIAYGLAGQEKNKEDEEKPKRNTNLAAVSAMGIFDAGAAQALAVSSFNVGGVQVEAGASGAVDKGRLMGAMRWDLWNPWAKWYELNSTHPLIANRLHYLADQAEAMGLEPYVRFDETQPESYWDEFFADIAIHLMPVAAFLAVIALAVVRYFFEFTPPRTEYLLPLSVALLGGAMLLRFEFAYRADFFAEMSIAALLKKVKVSAVRPVPCRLEGVIIGRGVPGYIFSEDFVMRDETGIIFLDFRQPLAIWEWLFGLLKAGDFQNTAVTVEGWYRRAPVPYIELRTITRDEKVTKSWVSTMNRISAIAIILAGMAWAVATFLGLAPI